MVYTSLGQNPQRVFWRPCVLRVIPRQKLSRSTFLSLLLSTWPVEAMLPPLWPTKHSNSVVPWPSRRNTACSAKKPPLWQWPLLLRSPEKPWPRAIENHSTASRHSPCLMPFKQISRRLEEDTDVRPFRVPSHSGGRPSRAQHLRCLSWLPLDLCCIRRPVKG